MGQTVFKRIQFPCNYFRCKASRVAGRSPPLLFQQILPACSTQSNMVEVCSLPLRLPGGSCPHHLSSDNQLAYAATN